MNEASPDFEHHRMSVYQCHGSWQEHRVWGYTSDDSLHSGHVTRSVCHHKQGLRCRAWVRARSAAEGCGGDAGKAALHVGLEDGAGGGQMGFQTHLPDNTGSRVSPHIGCHVF